MASAKKKVNVVKTSKGVKRVKVGKNSYSISYSCGGKRVTKECQSTTKRGAKIKCGVTKECKGVVIEVLRVGTGKYARLDS